MNSRWIRVLLLALLLALVWSYFALDLGQYFTLEFVKSRQAELDAYYQANIGLTIAIYMLIYIIVTALSLPGAVIMTLVGGALFGLLTGTIVISFASTIGATLAFLVSRFILRDYVEKGFPDRMRAINAGIEKEGAFYLFTLRLIPAFPFFMINLGMGLTSISTWRYYLVSQIGMLPGTIVYVNAGTQLGALESLRGILSPGLILSFVLLGIFPLLARRLVSWWKGRRILASHTRPRRFDYNIIVIGAGSGGLVSAYIASALKARVALVERDRMGGDCLNTGCVPSKALIRSAAVAKLGQRAGDFGLKSVNVEFEFSEVMARVQDVIRRIEPHDSVERYTALGVECIKGEGRLISPWQVQVGDKVLSARSIIVATGARPRIPDIPGLESVSWYTSDSIWSLQQLPGRLLVLGGGPIGCELAQSFARLGARVTLVQRAGRLLPAEDPEVSQLIAQSLRDDGVELLTETVPERFSREAGRSLLSYRGAGGEQGQMEFDAVLIALGRQANVSGFGLEELGVELRDNGTIASDEFLATNFPNIRVCGDVTGPWQFTHVAAHQAWYAAVNALFSPMRRFRADYRIIPRATYTDPEVARVGLNEQEAARAGVRFEVTRFDLAELDRAITEGEARGLVKVLTAPGKDRILGVTIAGYHAGDLIPEFVLAMKQGIGLNRILQTIHIYPTLSEANKYAAGVWRRQHAPQRVLSWLEAFHRWRRGGG